MTAEKCFFTAYRAHHAIAYFILLVFIGFFGCSDIKRSPVSAEGPATGSIKTRITLEKVGTLGKKAAINLSSCVIKLSSSYPDTTITETFPLSGNGLVTVSNTFTNLAAKSWNIEVHTTDQNGRYIHQGHKTATVIAGEVSEVGLNLDPLYSMLKANFYPIGDSVDKVELRIDGKVMSDSSFAAQSRLGDTVTLSYDYLSVVDTGYGYNYHIELSAYGRYRGARQLLYYGDTVFNIRTSQNTTYKITMRRMVDSSGSPGSLFMQAFLGAVGTIQVNGEMGRDTTHPGTDGLPKVTSISSDGYNLQVSGSYALWQSGSQIMLYDGSSARQISNNSNSPDTILMKGNKIAWRIKNGNNNQIYYYNGSSTELLANSSVIDNKLDRISDSAVVWHFHDGNHYQLSCKILGREGILSTNDTVDNVICECKGTRVVWTNNNLSIFCYDGNRTHLLSDHARFLGMRGYDIIYENSGLIYIFNGTSSTSFAYGGLEYSYLVKDPEYDTIVFIYLTGFTNGGEIWKLDAKGIGKIGDGFVFWGNNYSVIKEGMVTWLNSKAINFFNGDSTIVLGNSNSTFQFVDIHTHAIALSLSDGHDGEIYFYSGATGTKRVTNNNIDDDVPMVMHGGVIFHGAADNGDAGWIYWNGSTTRRFTTNNFHAPLVRYGEDFLAVGSQGINRISF